MLTNNANIGTYSRSTSFIDEISDINRIQPLLTKLPKANDYVAPGIQWGCPSQLYTPAYWKVQYHLHNMDDSSITHRFGKTILEEIVACLLGGYGLSAELGLLAFDRLKREKLISKGSNYDAILKALEKPFEKNGKNVRYRFPKQKAKFISELLSRKDLHKVPIMDDLKLRDWLLSVNGIGPKTASWVTRNWLNSEQVAIIDIHIYRAGILAGFFPPDSNINTEYFDLEKKFLYFCKTLDVKPSSLDALIWLQMKDSNKLAIKVLNC